MNRKIGFLLILVIALLISACGPAKSQNPAGEKQQPATVEKVDGSEFSRVTLTEKAVQRLDIQVTPVRLEQINGRDYTVIPYAAVLYGTNGETWSYTSPEPLVFIRQSITIDHIDADIAVLSKGPGVGTQVVVVGTSMLYGAEVGVSK